MEKAENRQLAGSQSLTPGALALIAAQDMSSADTTRSAEPQPCPETATDDAYDPGETYL